VALNLLSKSYIITTATTKKVKRGRMEDIGRDESQEAACVEVRMKPLCLRMCN